MITPERRRILVIDDNDAIHGDFRKTLESKSPTERLAAATAALFDEPLPAATNLPSFEMESALQGKEGFEKVKKAVADGKPYALAFVDMRMPPGWDGVETIQHLWEADPELQVVICTAFTDYSWEQITAKLGASDRFLILKKPFDPMEVCQLAASLTEKWKLKRQANLKVVELESMVHARTAELRKLAHFDRLTGLPNRAYLHDLLTRASARAAADPAFQFAIHFVDFDRFKIVNDSLGHDVGDQLLIAIADRFRTLFAITPETSLESAPCVAARLGGDEFVILQQGIASAADAENLAQNMLNTLAASYILGGFDVNSTASIGIALSAAGARWSADLLRDADSAMYVAKSNGKARYALFNQTMHQHAIERLTLESDLRRALKSNELLLNYQPIVSLADARLIGFEALVRWNHPARGLISPADFIPLAEETGLIQPLGHWVLTEALRQLQEWTREVPFANTLHMSVNVSRKQLSDAHFPAIVTTALADYGIAAARLNLEVTESTFIDDQKSARNLLTVLRDLGVHLHMDDFGTGYSSLNCLHGLPLDVLKIDRSFIQNISERRDYTAVINAIIALAHNLGMQVIAEGVETADHTAILSALDCDMVQGYFFSKPLPAAAARDYIIKSSGHLRMSFPHGQSPPAEIADPPAL